MLLELKALVRTWDVLGYLCVARGDADTGREPIPPVHALSL